jgi:hypothetical protein
MPVEPTTLTPVDEPCDGTTLRVLGWFSVGMAVAALGLYAAREIRSRYKFNRRTPYDFYSNAGESQSAEYGMGT